MFSLIGELSFIGVLLVSVSDTIRSNPDGSILIPTSLPATPHDYRNPLLGDVLAITAAVFYASYVILLKVSEVSPMILLDLTLVVNQVRIRSESRIDMQLFFGFVGAINIVALLPVGLILHLTGGEPLELPSTSKEWGGVLVNVRSRFYRSRQNGCADKFIARCSSHSRRITFW